MKERILLILFLVISMSLACSKGEKTKVKIAKSIEKKIELPKRLKVIDDLKKIRDAVVVYRNLKGINPASLENLPLELNYPDEYIYDSNRGTVRSKKYANY